MQNSAVTGFGAGEEGEERNAGGFVGIVGDVSALWGGLRTY